MKRQYLGDSKDSFKWDYHDYLTSRLGFSQLTVALMMTPDDGKLDGQTEPEEYAASLEIVELCHRLKASRDIYMIRELPRVTSADYSVELHRGGTWLTKGGRSTYFDGFSPEPDQVVFLDPDVGFEPQRCTDGHVRFDDVGCVLEQLTDDSFVSVFQHPQRYTPLSTTYRRIRERLQGFHVTQLHWHSLMFVAVATSTKAIAKVIEANDAYCADRPTAIDF
jgi:hypothetical protein